MSQSVVIVGGGLAGLFCALKLAPRPVTVLATSPLGEGASSAWAQGGIAAAMAEGDTPEKHTADTLMAGGGIVDEAITLGMAREAGDRVRDLLSFGVPFDKDLEGHLVQSREAAHSERRIVRVRGDMAGAAIMQALIAAVRQTPSITVHEGFTAAHLLTEGAKVTGVAARDEDGNLMHYHASDVVLATGGIGHLYAMTTNPKEACGNGISMAALAGAVIADAEFVQFHPTAIAIGRDPAPLATEALRGEGATLVNKAGKRFMQKLHKDAELAPRDIVARGVFAELQAGRGAFLDCRDAIGDRFAEAFPTVFATCQSVGINPAKDVIPIAPAEHYHMGGVLTSAEGRSSVEGLWAIGEVASTGVHGANRLASNSLLEAIVFAARVAEALPAVLGSVAITHHGKAEIIPFDPDLVDMLRQTMTDHVGVIRNKTGLVTAIWTLADIEATGEATEVTAMARAALFVAAAAYRREESRGGHYRSDYPEANPALAHRSNFTWDDISAIINTVLTGA
jgi:L-aspartate oxidase